MDLKLLKPLDPSPGRDSRPPEARAAARRRPQPQEASRKPLLKQPAPGYKRIKLLDEV